MKIASVDVAGVPLAFPMRNAVISLSVTWNPSTEGAVGRRPSSPARIPT
jgi:hypothetical protein